MNALALIDKYYPEENELKHILLTHSRSVADKALALARLHPELKLDLQFIEEAALYMISVFSLPMPMAFIVMVRILIFVMAIWELIWCVKKVIPAMHWYANVIREQGCHSKR